jgi:Sulfotransferase family
MEAALEVEGTTLVGHVSEVTQDAMDRDVLLAGNLESPKPNSASETYALELEGWVVGKSSRAVAIELVHDETEILTIPLNRPRADVSRRFPSAPGSEQSGFYLAFNTLRFPAHFTIHLVAVLENGDRGILATLRGSRRLLRPPGRPRFAPIALTSLGRSGSSFLSRLLASHPDIVGYRPFEYEPRIATYWTDILIELSSPKSYAEQIDPGGTIESHTWWIGDPADMQRNLSNRLEPGLGSWLGTTRIDDLAAMCRDRIDDLYERISGLCRKPADHFVEKTLPTNSTSLLCEIYCDAREVILVRDFRDMVASALAYSKQLGGRGLGRELAVSEDEYVRGAVRNSVLRLVRALDRRSARSHVVRYEDLVANPEDALRRILADLDVDDSDAALRATFEALERSTPDWAGRHRTSSDAQGSIGRWRRDLSPELQAVCNQKLGFGLVAFGYEL